MRRQEFRSHGRARIRRVPAANHPVARARGAGGRLPAVRYSLPAPAAGWRYRPASAFMVVLVQHLGCLLGWWNRGSNAGDAETPARPDRAVALAGRRVSFVLEADVQLPRT